ncbi:MAG: polysaccharide biosynthesis/export family protein [Bacteroidota bacterium]
MQIKLHALLLLIMLAVLTGCLSSKKVIYFQNSIPSAEQNKNYTPTIKPDDLLNILVTSMDAEASKPFNPFTNALSSNFIGGYVQGAQSPPGYLVDAAGTIDFPVIGKLTVGGLNRTQAIELLTEKLKPFLNAPNIQIRISNYKITVLGDVKTPGTFNIPNERITILEAIGLAGDLNITAKRTDIQVIRDKNGQKTNYLIDLTKSDFFASPAYFLEQNDVVYVKPNKVKINSGALNPSNAGIIISAISLLITMAILIQR